MAGDDKDSSQAQHLKAFIKIFMDINIRQATIIQPGAAAWFLV